MERSCPDAEDDSMPRKDLNANEDINNESGDSKKLLPTHGYHQNISCAMIAKEQFKKENQAHGTGKAFVHSMSCAILFLYTFTIFLHFP